MAQPVGVQLRVDCVKVAVNVTLWLGVRLMGNPLNPVMEKPAPVTVACEMATVDPPVLVKVSERLEVSPSCTLAKDSVDGDAAMAEPPEPLGATPWQPVSSAIPAAIKRELIKQRRDRKTRNASPP